MANTSSAKKAQRASLRRAVFNARRKKAMKEGVKDMYQALNAKKGAEAQALLPEFYQAIDKAAKLGTIKKNKAARMKSRVSKHLRALAK